MSNNFRVIQFRTEFVVKVPFEFSPQDAEAEARRILSLYAEQLSLQVVANPIESFEVEMPGVSLAT